jgi:Ca-activated chloride channel family protein
MRNSYNSAWLAIVLAAGLGLGASAPAQVMSARSDAGSTVSGVPDTAESAVSDENQAITFRKQVEEVYVIFTVTTRSGHLVNALKKQQFQVFDNHQPATDIVSFTSESGLPLRIGLLIDSSSSVRDRFDLEQQAALAFLAQVLRPSADQAFVMGFDSHNEVTQDFTGNPEKLAKGIRKLHAGGGTAMYDAVYDACRKRLMETPAGGRSRRAIILLSDGEDNQSDVTLAQAIEMAQRAEVMVYAISTNYSNIKMHGDQVLAQLAEATGGRAFFPLRSKDVVSAFTQIRNELRSQYALAYKPANIVNDGRYHSIEIVADNNKYLVHARKGYYAPNQ